jgi:hypothetical protein
MVFREAIDDQEIDPKKVLQEKGNHLGPGRGILVALCIANKTILLPVCFDILKQIITYCHESSITYRNTTVRNQAGAGSGNQS